MAANLTPKQMNNLKNADLPTLFKALESALKDAITAHPIDRTGYLATATWINDEINRRA